VLCSLSACVLATLPERRDSISGLQDYLFPAFHTYNSGFTTADGVEVDGVSSIGLSDSALNVIKVTSGLTHNVVQQDGKTAWQAVYPQGSWNPSNAPKGGFGLYVNGTDDFKAAVAAGANQVIFGYSIMFQDGFEWNMGGKIPGGYGGVGSFAYECSGGRQDNREECFDLRLMWRTDGEGELYTYLPLTDENAAVQLTVPPLTVENTDYGFSVGRGSFNFTAGEWFTITERILLNDPDSYNGQVRIWINGQSVIELEGVSMRNSSDSVVMGMHFQTFFGGSTSDWASPINQSAWFADVSGAIIDSTS